MRLIDVDKIKLPHGYFEKVDNVPKFYNWLDTLPIVDAEPIRHGHWIYREYGYPLAHNFYTCSVCGSSRGLNIDNYCPHCGAKMDEGDKDELDK